MNRAGPPPPRDRRAWRLAPGPRFPGRQLRLPRGWLVLGAFVMLATPRSSGDEPAGFGPESAEVEGLRCALRLERESCRVGQPIAAWFRIRNASDQTRTIYQCGFYPNHQVIVRDEQGRLVAPTALGRRAQDAFAPSGPRRKNVPIDLAPGDTNEAQLPDSLTSLLELTTPGVYRVQVTYEERSLPWIGRLESPAMVLTITP